MAKQNTNQQKWAAQLFTISGAPDPERTIPFVAAMDLQSQMKWLKAHHRVRKDWKPQTLSGRPIYANWPDFVMDQHEITEVWRNESGEVIKKIAHTPEEGFKEIEAWGKKALKHGSKIYEEQN